MHAPKLKKCRNPLARRAPARLPSRVLTPPALGRVRGPGVWRRAQPGWRGPSARSPTRARPAPGGPCPETRAAPQQWYMVCTVRPCSGSTCPRVRLAALETIGHLSRHSLARSQSSTVARRHSRMPPRLQPSPRFGSRRGFKHRLSQWPSGIARHACTRLGRPNAAEEATRTGGGGGGGGGGGSGGGGGGEGSGGSTKPSFSRLSRAVFPSAYFASSIRLSSCKCMRWAASSSWPESKHAGYG